MLYYVQVTRIRVFTQIFSFLSAYMPGSVAISILLMSKLTRRKLNRLTCPRLESQRFEHR